MMDIHEPAQEFRHLAAKSTSQSVIDDDDEMVLNYSDSDDSSKLSKNENLKEALDLLDKVSESPMEANDDDFADKLHNGDTAFNDESKNDDSGLSKSDFFPTPQNEDVEKLSLLDRFLSSEVVENGKANSTELIGDELVDEQATELLDENALLDEITNDLDNSQEELDDECLLEEDITEIVAKDDKTNEVTSSQPDVTISPANETVDIAEKEEEEKNEPVVESSETVSSSEIEIEPIKEPDTMEVEEEDNEQTKLSSKENVSVHDTTESSSDKEVENVQESNEATINEPVVEKTQNILKVDEDNDNNLLEEMVDSPRSSEHESMTSELLEKDDAVTHDSNDDEKMDQQLIVESSNENSNMSEGGAMGENGLDVVGEFKHDGEIHIMDEASVDAKLNEAENVETKVKYEMETGIDVKMETDFDGDVCKKENVEEVVADHETSSSDNLKSEKSTDEHSPSETVADEATEQSCETLSKRKNDTEVSDEPETKRKRVEEVPISESAGSSEAAVADGNDIDVAENEASVVVSTTEASDENHKESTENSSKDDDDDVLIVGEIKQTESTNNKESSTATEIKEPVQKAKILILDTQAIANDLGEEVTAEKTSSDEISAGGPTEKEPEVSSSLDESAMQTEDEPPVESTEKSQEPKVVTPLVLDPPPQKTLCPTAFSLNFVRKFQKNFDKMNRNDLEELLIQKCVEVIVHKSEYADMRNKIEKQESKLQSYSTKYQELSKQYRDLEMVHQRVVKDLEVKNQSVVTPVKITRAVGLQVSLPRKEITIQKPSQPANTLQTTAQQNNAALAAKNRRKIPVQPNPQMQQQQQQQQIIRQNMLARRNELQIQQRTQFQAQQQGQNNLLKQQLIQNNQANNFKQQANVRKPVTPQFSPVAANQMQNVSPKTPGSADRPRVPPVILKKMTPGRMGAVNSSSPNSSATIVYSSQTKAANTSITRSPAATASMNNLIDLTDEEDSRRVVQNGSNPPALVAIPNNQGNKTVVGQGKVQFLTLKNASPQAQVQVVQQNRLATMQKIGVPIAPKSNVPPGQQIVQVRRQQPATTINAVQRRQHPAPLPYPNNQPTNPYWKLIPPRPIIRINNIESGIVISWTMDEMNDKHAEVASYQIYAYQETSAAPSPETWRHVGDVKAMLLPMAVTLTQFQEGQRYHFAVRAVDEHSRYGIFSLPKTWT